MSSVFSEIAARRVSQILYPLNVICLTSFIFAVLVRRSFVLGILDTSILGISLVPGIVLLAARKQKKIVVRKQIVLVVLLAGFFTSLVVFTLIGAPTVEIQGLLIGLIAGIGATVINYIWDISFHAATSAGCAALFLGISPLVTVFIAALSLLVGITRIIIKEHTIPQVFVGWLYGFGVTSLLVSILAAYSRS